MIITKKHLDAAVQDNILTREQVEALLDFLKRQPNTRPSFDFTHVLYYFGGMVAIGAMTLFMNMAWESFGGWGIFFLSLLYAMFGLKLTLSFQKKGYAVPAGICATFAVALTPLAIYGVQQGMGWWPDDSVYREYHRYIEWHWLYMELGTLVTGALVVWKFKYPFLLMPIALTLWYMSMDLAAMLGGGWPDFELRAMVSMYFGLFILLLAFWVDLRTGTFADYAFWLYLFGVMAFWGGLSAQDSDSELSKFFYFCINILMIGIGVLVVRRVFLVFGALGVSLYLGHLASSVFQDTWLFPISLTFIGLGIVYLGILWQKNEHRIIKKVHAFLPAVIRELLQARAV